MSDEIYYNIRNLIPNRFYKVKEKYREQYGLDRGFSKYFKESNEIKQKLGWARMLGLDNGIKCKVLELGCGAGFFAFVMSYFGHMVFISDVEDGRASCAYKECLEALDMLKDFEIRINRQVRLPMIVGKYDLITATGIAFHEDWTESDWSFFLNDLRTHLKEDGRIFLNVNRSGKAAVGYKALKDLINDESKWIEGVNIIL